MASHWVIRNHSSLPDHELFHWVDQFVKIGGVEARFHQPGGETIVVYVNHKGARTVYVLRVKLPVGAS